MAANALAARVPMLSPVRVESLARNPFRFHRRRAEQPLYQIRRWPNRQADRFSYGDQGHPVLHDHKGRVIDLYA